QNTFCPEGGVCKHGFLIKSPPLQLFSSQNSWKRRLFVLSKSSKGDYILKYLKGQHVKGSIAVDQIISIEVGISNAEIMETVRRMFKCLPEQVMSISTGNRCYYLIGNSRQETEDWVTLISSVCREDKRSGCCPQGEIAATELLGSCSHKALCKWPSERKMNVGKAPPVYIYVESTSFLCTQENGSSEDRNRPYSDPGPHQAQCDSPRGVFPSPVSRTNQTALAFLLNTNPFFQQDKILGRSEENLLLSDPEEDIKKDEEDYYQTPSNVLAKVVYQLKLLDERCQLTCRRDGLPSPPKCQNNGACPRDLEANRDTKFPESSTSLQPTLQRRQNSLPLSVVHLSILLSQVTDEMQLQKLDIFVPLADINDYLKLTEAAGRI
ncbi:PKHS1 protein, partial [Machaerirhynchus nigripectus]|nr:PKHS1 protein [Machaerirhynchus nigripectus]